MPDTIWITRSAPFHQLTARRLRSIGIHPLVAPALHVVPLPARRLIAVPDALAFTSLQAIRFYRFPASFADIPVFTVGDRSARFAERRGYRRVSSASGDLSDLCRLLHHTLPRGADVLHVSAAEPAGDLLAMLRDDGFAARRLCVYRTEEASPRELEWIAGELARIDAILIHSPRAGRHVASWLKRHCPAWPGEIYCISPAAAAAFGMLAEATIKVAARPNETDLLKLLLSRAATERR